jgi:hypothetical protein
VRGRELTTGGGVVRGRVEARPPRPQRRSANGEGQGGVDLRRRGARQGGDDACADLLSKIPFQHVRLDLPGTPPPSFGVQGIVKIALGSNTSMTCLVCTSLPQ